MAAAALFFDFSIELGIWEWIDLCSGGVRGSL